MAATTRDALQLLLSAMLIVAKLASAQPGGAATDPTPTPVASVDQDAPNTTTTSMPTATSSSDIDPCRLMADPPEGCEPIVCPENSCFIVGNNCLDSMNDCLCIDGYTMQDDVCVSNAGFCLSTQYHFALDDCEPISCPTGSCVDPDEACVDDIAKCICQGGFTMNPEEESCVDDNGAVATDTPVCMDSYELDAESGLCEPASTATTPMPGGSATEGNSTNDTSAAGGGDADPGQSPATGSQGAGAGN